ncbi:MAG: peroxide stress protein YaaA [Clostridiales bacterium]|nr:peroxide stress protein YaaA [Clostridiales bacterium]
MKIIISPAKKMKVDTDAFDVTGLPELIHQTSILMDKIQSLSYSEAKALWQCNDKIAELNYERFQNMDLHRRLTPALIAYEGLQYQHIAPDILTEKELAYLSEHLRILSGFYGILRPFDGVTAYRLEMQAKLSVNGYKDLYEFWGDSLYKKLVEEDRTIINLASKEYSQCIEKYITEKDKFITIEFGELVNGKVKQKGTIAKMARGEMVKFMARNQISNLKDIKDFHELGFTYSKEFSNEEKYVFLL